MCPGRDEKWTPSERTVEASFDAQPPRASKLHIYDFKCQVCVLLIYDILFSKITGQGSPTVPDE